MTDADQFLITEEMRLTRPREVEDEMDLTPMVDVTFLLLIFFMITAAFAVQKAIGVPPVDEEQAASSQIVEELQQDTIVVRIDGDNIFWVGAPNWSEEQRALSVSQMQALLREARADGAAGPQKMLVQAHGDSRHGSVVAVLDSGAGLGIEQISLLSYEEGELGF